MSAISKFFEEGYKYRKCEEVFHPGKTCMQSALHDFVHFLPSNAKFFFPFALIPLLMRIKRFDHNLLKNSLLYFAETTVMGYLVGNTITTSACLLRNIIGRFSIYTVVAIPAFLAGSWVFATSDQVARLYALSVAQAVVEAVFRNKDNPATRVLHKSRLLQTFIFMICSSLNLQMIRQHKYKVFWFVTPPPKQSRKDQIQTNINKNKCTHKTTCQNYVLTGIKEYFSIGFALENIKILVYKIRKTRSVSDYLSYINWYAISFLVSYIGVYRLSYCTINRCTELDPNLVHLIASCLGGSSFIFYPKPLIVSYAIVLLCEITWRSLKKKQEKYPEPLQRLLKFPTGRALFPFTLAAMVHGFVFHNNLVANLGAKIVNGVTNSRGKLAMEILMQAMRSSQSI